MLANHFCELSKLSIEEFLNIPVETNMRSTPSASPLDPISSIVDLMIKGNSGAIVVLEEERPVGIITEKDVLERVIKAKKNFELTLVKDIMSKPVVSIEDKQPIKDALNIMHKCNIRRLIITKNGFYIGLTTERRLLEVAHGLYLMKNYSVIKSVPQEDGGKISVAYLSTYPPRQCGIAVYTKELVNAISILQAVKPPAIVAMNDRHGHYDYSIEVKSQIDQSDIESYTKAANYINESDIDIVNLQHEYGLFDGVWGEHVITFLEKLEKPVITTLHTILQEPVMDAKRVMEGIFQRSDFVIVMARLGIKMLEEQYGSLADKIRYIPHGCPNVPYLETGLHKKSLGLDGRVVLSTFGLLSRGKGVEYAIEALPQLVKENSKIIYLIIGVTHPEVRKQEGETYRGYLQSVIESFGLEKNVRFVNRFLTRNEVIRYLQATDIYIIPYPNREQISSGTLSYALSTGKAIVTTPFLQAEEVISEGVVMGSNFKDPYSITDCVTTLLKNNETLERYRTRAYEYSRNMIWPNVAMKYVNLAYHALQS